MRVKETFSSCISWVLEIKLRSSDLTAYKLLSCLWLRPSVHPSICSFSPSFPLFFPPSSLPPFVCLDWLQTLCVAQAGLAALVLPISFLTTGIIGLSNHAQHPCVF